MTEILYHPYNFEWKYQSNQIKLVKLMSRKFLLHVDNLSTLPTRRKPAISRKQTLYKREHFFSSVHFTEKFVIAFVVCTTTFVHFANLYLLHIDSWPICKNFEKFIWTRHTFQLCKTVSSIVWTSMTRSHWSESFATHSVQIKEFFCDSNFYVKSIVNYHPELKLQP